jgi:hypothetical protein
VTPREDGKAVWALLPLEDPLPAGDDDDHEEQSLTGAAAALRTLPTPAGPLALAGAA